MVSKFRSSMRFVVMVWCSVALWNAVAGTEQPMNQPKLSPAISSVRAVDQGVNHTVDINRVDFDTLSRVKYLSKAKAKAIIAYREKQGQFKSVDELLKVNCRGIHEKWLAKVKKYLTI